MEGQEPKECHDLQALANSPVSLLAVSPKDMFDLGRTIKAMEEAGITILGYHSDVCDGYLFEGEKVKISGCWREEDVYKRQAPGRGGCEAGSSGREDPDLRRAYGGNGTE